MASATLSFIPHGIFSDKSLRLCTLWDMISSPTYKIVNHAFGLTQMRDDMKTRFHEYLASDRSDFSRVEYSDNDRAGIAEMNANMRPWLVSHALTGSVARLDRVVSYAADPDCHIDDLANQINTLMEELEFELGQVMVFCIPREDADFYERPGKWFPTSPAAFPSAKYDIEEACECYALERYTACVFHSMAVLQVGLYTLAHDLGVLLKYPVQLAEWQEVISAIEGKIEPLRQLPRSHPKKDDLLTFYSGCATQFRYFKDAWRNHIAHMRDRYTRTDAHSILMQVRDFMEMLSTRLHE
jgi:hypothetical protein